MLQSRSHFRITFLIIVFSALLPKPAELFACEALPARYDGSMTPISLEAIQPLARAVPDSLTPIFADYLGRHGARYLSSAKKVDKLLERLNAAGAAGRLTSQGEDFVRLLKRVKRQTAGRWGTLDSIGMEEQQTLAKDMYEMFPEMLRQGRVTAEATYVPRVVMSMYEFCHTLGSMAPDLEIYTSAGKQNSPLLRFFDTDKEYAVFLSGGGWKLPLEEFESRVVPALPAERLIKKGTADDKSELRKMSLAMYGVLQSLRATGMGVPTTEWMTADEYEACWRAENLDHYLRRTDTPLSTVAGRAACPLLESFIAYGDSAAGGKDKELKARLRFGHAETLMPLLSLMHIEGCDVSTSDYADLQKYWCDYNVVPLGANLLVAILRGPSGKTYAAIRVNGIWKSPLSDGRLYVGWEELKAVWRGYMRAVGVVDGE